MTRRVRDSKSAADFAPYYEFHKAYLQNLQWGAPKARWALKGVTQTLERHGDGRGLDATMIEIRHDEILEPNGVAHWADRLARCLHAARGALRNEPAHLSPPTIGAHRLEGRD